MGLINEHHTAASFRARYAFFADTPDPLVEEVLEDKAAETPVAIFGNKTRQMHGLRTARALVLDPYGRPDARLLNKDGSTVFDADIASIELAIGASMAPRTA